jgi:hypothetical protein
MLSAWYSQIICAGLPLLEYDKDICYLAASKDATVLKLSLMPNSRKKHQCQGLISQHLVFFVAFE